MKETRKISILERILKERDDEISKLKQENAELQSVIDSYGKIDDGLEELREAINETQKLNKEYNDVNNEYTKLRKEYRKEMNKFMRKQKIRRYK